MPGSNDSAYDLELNDGAIGLMIDAPPTTGSKFSRTYQGIAEPKTITYANWNLGMGHDDYHVDGGYGWGEGCSTRHRGVVMAAGALSNPVALPAGGNGNWSGAFTYGNDLYLVGGSRVYKIASGDVVTNGVTLEYSSGTGSQFFNPVRFGVGTQAGVYIGVANVTAGGIPVGIVKFNGSAWSAYAGGTTGPGFLNLATVYWDTNGAQGQRLIGMDGYYSFRTLTEGTADPLSATAYTDPANPWSSSIKVGDGFTAIRSLATTAHHIYFCTQGGVRDIDARLYCPNITPYFETFYDYDNGAVNFVMDGYLYVSYARGLTRVPLNGMLQQGPEPCHPNASMSSHSPIFGPVTAMTEYKGWLIASVYNPIVDKSYICWGKDKERTNNPAAKGPLEWHGAEAVIDGKIEQFKIHTPNSTPASPGATRPLLWIMGNKGGLSWLRYQDLHQSESYYQDYKNGASTSFQPYWELNLADGLPEARTLFRVPWEYETESENASSTARIQVKISADGAAHTLEGTMYTSPRDRIPAGANVESCTRMDVRIIGDQLQEASIATTTPLVLRGVRIPCSVHGQKFEVRSYPIGIARGQRLRNGAPDSQDPGVVTDAIVTLHSETANLVTMKDDTGEYTVEVISSDDANTQERHGDYEQRLNLVVRIIGVIDRYDQGAHWDSTARYG